MSVEPPEELLGSWVGQGHENSIAQSEQQRKYREIQLIGCFGGPGRHCLSADSSSRVPHNPELRWKKDWD